MRVLIAGATGALGSRLVSLLVRAGHRVTGVTRTSAKAAEIERAGATPAIVDALDRRLVRDLVLEARPEVVIHEMTALANASDLTHFDRSFAMTNRLRTEGLDHLLAAARESGARRVIAQSFCGWPYARTGGPVKTEEEPLDPNPPREFRKTLDAIRHLENAVAGAAEFEGLVLRYGAFYGPRSGLFDGPMVDQLRRRRVPLIGDGGGWWSFLHLDDAAAATALAVVKGAPGLYNIVDDDPAPVRDWLPAFAAMLGAKPPRRIPRWVAQIAAGEHLVAMMTENRAGSNLKARRELGWSPTHQSWRTGFAEVIAATKTK
ncbi:MAG TPA: NAD(P)-dependent oxidoreductase [Roseiarcus sp.]